MKKYQLRAFAAMALGVLCVPAPALAGKRIIVEAVDNYTSSGYGSLTNSKNDASHFLYQMQVLYNPVGFVPFAGGNPVPGSFYDSHVWTSDFMDPQITGVADQDYFYFDKRGNAISYFAGHGNTSLGWTGIPPGFPGSQNAQPCSHILDCQFAPSSPAGLQNPGFCQRQPGDSFGYCAYTEMKRSVIVDSFAGPAGRAGFANYSSGNIKWGESQFSAWSGANANGISAGGTNAVFLHTSGGSYTRRERELFPAFAGVHMIGTVLVQTGDTLNVDYRGYWFAAGYTANPASSVANSWLNAISSLPGPGTNQWCGDFNATWGLPSSNPGPLGAGLYGGGHGEAGCGGHSILALGATVAEASAFLQESWQQLPFDSRDGKGGAFFASQVSCNYDCSTWTFDLP
jgi:hypothetical protein